MSPKLDFPTVAFVALVAFMLLGAGLAYPLNTNEFKSEVTSDSASIQVDMHSTILSDYSVCAIDMANNAERQLLFYYDEAYASTISHETEWENAEKLDSHLKYLKVSHTVIDAEGLLTVLSDTSTASAKSIAVFSGAFPDNVYAYDGTAISLDLVKPWMEAGGIVYWQSEARFGYYSAPLTEDFKDWETDQPMDVGATEFGLSFLGDIKDDQGIGGKTRSAISGILCIEQSMVMNYAVVGNSSMDNLGFESDDGRYSIAYAKYGSGGTVIMGGDFTPEISLAKIIASRVCDWADYSPAVQTGQFKGDTLLTFEKSGVDAVYVYMGTLTPRYGELFFL